MAEPIRLRSMLADAIADVRDRKRMSAGITACMTRAADFTSEAEMQLAGIAMVPEARAYLSQVLTDYWDDAASRNPGNLEDREVIIGAGYHAAVYAASRVAAGFPRPVVLEQSPGEQVGGAFAISLNPVFRLNSRNRPGTAGLPDQDKALQYIPGGLIQPSMVTSEEYPTNADMAWVIRATLAQFADVYTGISVSGISASSRRSKIPVTTSQGELTVGRILDARGIGTPTKSAVDAASQCPAIRTFPQFMAQMGDMFPLRGMQQVAVIGGPDRLGLGGDSAKCAIESLLGIAPGGSSLTGLDYVSQVDWYAELPDGQTCTEFRKSQRGRYIRLAQFLRGNKSNTSTRLRVMGTRGFATPIPGGVLVNSRTYDMAIIATGTARPFLRDSYSYFPYRVPDTGVRTGTTGVLATWADPIESYRIGPAADIDFSPEESASLSTGANPANKVAMFRLGPRTAALASTLKSVPGTS